jgi:hypothetical protein
MHGGSLEMGCNPMVDIRTCIQTLKQKAFFLQVWKSKCKKVGFNQWISKIIMLEISNFYIRF